MRTEWLCCRRQRWPDGAEVLALRRRWPEERERLIEELEVFPARDAVVLKAMALVLERVLPVSRRRLHVKGHGGAKAAVRRVAVRLRRLPFVLRTDVRRYYASIDPVKRVERLARYVTDPELLRLVGALTARSSERGGSTGTPAACPSAARFRRCWAPSIGRSWTTGSPTRLDSSPSTPWTTSGCWRPRAGSCGARCGS